MPGYFEDLQRCRRRRICVSAPVHKCLSAIEIFIQGNGCKLAQDRYNGALATGERRYGDPIGPPATITREPGQIRKEAATAGTLCAGVWLVGLPPISKSLILQGLIVQKSRSVTAFRYT